MTLDLLLIPLLLALVWLAWASQQRAKNLALMQVRKRCASESLQLLDDTLVFEKLWLGRYINGGVCIKRRYQFEFSSTGEHRYQGQVTLAGQRLAALQLAPHHIG
nr:DUF3301 domain-containing protein [Oceanobacter mangrovi]